MQPEILKQLVNEGLLHEDKVSEIKASKAEKPLSLYRDMQTLLYAGILLLTTGLGVFVYNNINSIGHVTIITITGICCAVCFGWCIAKGGGFTLGRAQPPNTWFDYVLLLGSLLLLTFTGYLQYRFHVFGNRWGMALFIPMVLLFLTAYYFDHLGILSLAITNLAAWAGITVTPLQILQANDFTSERVIYAGVILGAALMVIAMFTTERNIKQHFAFTYKNFGAHIMLICCIAGMFLFDNIYPLWFVILMLPCLYLFFTAVREGSLYFILVSLLYTWFGVSFVITRVLLSISVGMEGIYLMLLYYIASAFGVIMALIYYNKKLKKNDGL